MATLYEKVQNAAITHAVVDPATGRRFDRNSFTAADLIQLRRLNPNRWPYSEAYLNSWPANSTKNSTLGRSNKSGYSIKTARNPDGTYKLL